MGVEKKVLNFAGARSYITLYFMNEGFSSSAKSAQHFAMEHSYKENEFLRVQSSDS